MKKIIFYFFLCFNLFQSNASAQNNTKTLFGDSGLINSNNLGFFVAPSYGFTKMDGSNATLLNLRSGISFKDRFTVGGYFSISHNESRPQSESIPNVYLEHRTAGGFAEYTVLSEKVFHVTFPFSVGYGEVQMINENGTAEVGRASFFQIEQSALLEVNLLEYLRFNMGAGYRVLGQLDYRNFNQSDISGLTLYLGLKFGMFSE